MRTADISGDKLMEFLQHLAGNGYELMSVKHATTNNKRYVTSDYTVEFDKSVAREGLE